MLQQEPMLTSREQYRNELMNIPLLSKDEQDALEMLAREGDEQAKVRLIEEAIHFVERFAYRYSNAYLTQDDHLDLVQVGNLALIECLDLALIADRPTAYLCGTARRAIISYTMHHSRLINLPRSLTVEQVREVPKTVSLEALIEKADPWFVNLFSEIIVDLDTASESAFDTFYDSLNVAVGSLKENQQEVIQRHLGINEHAQSTFAEIDRELGSSKGVSRKRYMRGLRHLQQTLKRA